MKNNFKVLSEKGAELSHAVRKAESYEREVQHCDLLCRLDHPDHLVHLDYFHCLDYLAHFSVPLRMPAMYSKKFSIHEIEIEI